MTNTEREATDKRTSGWLRLSTWIVSGLACVLVLILMGLGLYTQTDHFRLWLREQALAALRAAVNGEVTLERVSGSVWEGILFHHLSVRQNGIEVLTVPQGVVTIDLLPQLSTLFCASTLRVAHLVLTAPVVTLVQDQENGWNITRLFTPSDQQQAPQTFTLFVDRISVEGGRIDIRPAASEDLHVTPLSLDGSLALLPSGTRVALATLNFALARAGVPDTQWTGGLSYDGTGFPSVLRLPQLDVHTAVSHLRVSGAVENLSAPTTALTVEAERLAVGDLQMLLPALPLQQDVSGTARLTGPLSAFQLFATLQAPNGQVTTSVTADLTRTPPQYQGTLAVERFVVDKMLRLAQLSAEVNGQLSFAGATFDTAQSALQAHVSGLLVQGLHVGDLDLTGNLAQGQIALTGEAKGKGGQALWHSRITLGTPLAYEGTLTVRNLDLAQVTGRDQALATNLSFDAWVKGSGTSLPNLDAAARLTLSPSRLGTITVTQGKAAGALRHGQVTVDEVTLVTNEASLTARGQIGGLHGTPSGTITYTLLAKDLAPWLALAGLRGEGQASVTGTARGALTALRLDGKATLSHLRVAGSSLQSGAVTYALADIGSSQPRGQVTAALNQVHAGMRLRSVRADLTLAGLHPAEVQAEFVAQDDGMRTHRLKVQARYEPQRLDVYVQELALQLPAGTWRMAKPTRLALSGSRLTIDDFLLQRTDQTVSARGVLAWQGAQDLRVQVHRLPLAELRALLGAGPDMSGQVSAEVQVQGTAASPAMVATLTTDALTVAGQSYAGLTAQGAYRQERLDLNLRLRQDATHSLTVEGAVPISLGWTTVSPPALLGEADLRIRSEGLSLAFLGLVSREIQDVQGTLSVDVRVRGPVQALVPAGEVEVLQGQARVKPLGLALTDIGLKMQLAPGAFQVTQLSLRAGEGQLSGSGALTLRQYTITALDLTLDADRFRVINTRQYVGAVSGQLVCSGSLQRPVLRGALEFGDLRLHPDLALLRSGPAAPDPTIVVVQSAQDVAAPIQPAQAVTEHKAEPASPLQSDLYDQLGLDLTLTVPRGTWVHLDEGSVEIMGEVRVRKAPVEELSLTGSIETVRGWYAFHGRKFRLERGRMLFTGGSLIDPSLDIVARYALPKYQVDVTIGGTARAPTLTLHSDPQLEQTDILSLLLFGRPANALSKGEKSSLQSQALQAVAGYVAADLRQSVAEQLGLDNLEFDVGETPGQSRVGVGKQVSTEVFVSSSQQLGGKGGREFSIEYQLDPNWQLKASTTSQGNSGIDLFWHKRY